MREAKKYCQEIKTKKSIQIMNRTPYNSTSPKGGVSRSKDSFVVNGSLVFQIIPIAIGSGASPALRVAANR